MSAKIVHDTLRILLPSHFICQVLKPFNYVIISIIIDDQHNHYLIQELHYFYNFTLFYAIAF